MTAPKKRAATRTSRTSTAKASHDDVLVREATAADAQAAGSMGAALAAAHHAWDPKRFFVVPDMADGYAWWLKKEIKNDDAVVLVAEKAGAIVGYAYGRIEERDWNSLREKCGAGVDLFVDPKLRRSGVGKRLGLALIDALAKKGAPFVVLGVSAKNTRAQGFFKAMGCRPTMIEMTLDVTPKRSLR